MVPLCREEHIALTPYSALAGGTAGPAGGPKHREAAAGRVCPGKIQPLRRAGCRNHPRVEKIAHEKGVSMTQVALRWLLSKTDSP